MLNDISRWLGILACILSAFVFGVYDGFYSCGSVCDIRYPLIGGVWWSDLDPYYFFARSMWTVLIALLIFTVSTFVSFRWISYLAGFVSLLLAAYNFWRMFSYKYDFWDPTDNYLRMSQRLLQYELVIFSLVAVLFVLEILTIVKWARDRRQTTKTARQLESAI